MAQCYLRIEQGDTNSFPLAQAMLISRTKRTVRAISLIAMVALFLVLDVLDFVVVAVDSLGCSARCLFGHDVSTNVHVVYSGAHDKMA